MTTTNSQIQNYLDRIGFTGSLDGSAKTLAELQERHLHSVPYENLDIVERKALSLDPQDLYHKIVTRRRGGYCFELNALFGWLLREAGYPVTDWVARFWRDESLLPPKRRHHVLKVEAEGINYLCDVGVGGIVPRRPLALIEDVAQQQGEECYRLTRDAAYGWELGELKNGEWNRLYTFTEEPQLPHDYLFASYWCEHAPDSIFNKYPIIAIRTSEGRNTVSNQEFRIFTSSGVNAFTPQTEEAYKEALRTHFGISLSELR
ncbi:arylamine N-acetyltransferase [Paenibacillus sp. GCM10023248]|uniref:arylamine N-acetyltransferase family protein n=1 Tax=Bacillales TaxID=1385 RepID=UPI002378223F|nr:MULTISPECIES: arylamine N-acetyltransferase [Bacillales]MDD9268277.1 arylamine N-acetyltransferase [Paenibacillus sp. MAHUQ-63]MDR6879955.1 N-hydroxyarylamine O-acetyltransferase [Bacillus sp. 3255]